MTICDQGCMCVAAFCAGWNGLAMSGMDMIRGWQICLQRCAHSYACASCRHISDEAHAFDVCESALVVLTGGTYLCTLRCIVCTCLDIIHISAIKSRCPSQRAGLGAVWGCATDVVGCSCGACRHCMQCVEAAVTEGHGKECVLRARKICLKWQQT